MSPFSLGFVAGVAATFAITAVFAWIFITVAESDWSRRNH